MRSANVTAHLSFHGVITVSVLIFRNVFGGSLQVFRFVQNLIGCEEQARLFKEEVRPPNDYKKKNKKTHRSLLSTNKTCR